MKKQQKAPGVDETVPFPEGRCNSPEPGPTSPRTPQPAPYYIQALPPSVSKIVVYECPTCFYLVGMLRRSLYSLMRIERTSPEDPVVRCEPGQLTGRDVQEFLSKAEIQNRGNGGLRRFCRVYGLLGMVKFVQGYYVLLISKRKKVGAIAGHNIYTVEEISYLRIAPQTAKFPSATYADENRYSALFFGYDFSNLYFSYTYDVTRPLQYNMTRHLYQTPRERQEKFVWNYFLLERISSAQNAAPWTLPVIHGYFKQAVSGTMGKCLSIALVSRRSRHFAGVRYLKRGLNSEGSCANDVETEQIVQDLSYGDVNGNAHLSSYVQIRGSIPLFWSQEQQSIAPKPPISIFRVDPFYNALALHFKDLFASYSTPIVFLNLVKSREKVPRESILKEQLEESLLFINERLPAEKQIVYIPWDFHEAQKNKNEDPVSPLVAIAETSLVKTGFFYTGVHGRHKSTSEGLRMPSAACEQSGVIRTNCIDSLDRTNAAQFCIGKVVLAHQLYVLGHSESRLVDSDDHLMGVLMNLYEDMGNTIALQYGGSQLAHTLKTYQRQSSSQARDLFTTVQRFYNNSFTDFEKQAVMNLFLGHFVPALQTQRLWELETDYFLHMRTDFRARPLSASAWWTPPPPRLPSGPAPPPLFQQFGRYYRLGRLTSFDKMLSQAYNIPSVPPPADATDPVKFYLPGVKRWFGRPSAAPLPPPPVPRRRSSVYRTNQPPDYTLESDLVEEAYLLYGVHVAPPPLNQQLYEGWARTDFLSQATPPQRRVECQKYAEVRQYRNHTLLPRLVEQRDRAVYAAYVESSAMAPAISKASEAFYRNAAFAPPADATKEASMVATSVHSLTRQAADG